MTICKYSNRECVFASNACRYCQVFTTNMVVKAEDMEVKPSVSLHREEVVLDLNALADKVVELALQKFHAVKTGKWIEHKLDIITSENAVTSKRYAISYECSCCGRMYEEITNYCPNCGAKMESE